MPSLKSVLEKLDDIPEEQHQFYEEKDGKYILLVDRLEDHPGLNTLTTSLAKLKEERKRFSEELKALREKASLVPDDFNPEELATLRAKIEEYENNKDRGGPDQKTMADAVAARKLLEQKIAGMEKSAAADAEKYKEQIARRDKKIENMLIDEGLTKSLIEAGVSKEYLRAAKALLAKDVKVVEEDGDYSAIVTTDAGDYDIDRYVTDWVASDEGKPFVPAPKGADAGTQKPFKIGSDTKNPWSKQHWNLTEQGRLFRTDRAKAEKLAKAEGHKLPIPG